MVMASESREVPRESTGRSGQSPEDAADDPLLALLGRLGLAWSALRLHLSILAESARSSLYRGLLAIYITSLWVLATLVTTIFGAYYLVQGVALGLSHLTGSAWQGGILTGIVFLGLPALVGYLIATMLRKQRHRRLEKKYIALRQERMDTP